MKSQDMDFCIVLLTKNFQEQLKFYKNIMGLDLLFQSKEVAGLGKSNRLFVLLREELAEDSHHLAEHKGPSIITFRLATGLDQWIEDLKKANIKIRDQLSVPEYDTKYLFIEDHDGNEVCLEFSQALKFSSP